MIVPDGLIKDGKGAECKILRVPGGKSIFWLESEISAFVAGTRKPTDEDGKAGGFNTILYTLGEKRGFEDFPNFQFKACN